MQKQSIIDHTRGTAAVSVLIVLPLAQIVSVRIAPVMIAFAVIICFIASYFEAQITDNFVKSREHSAKALRWTAIFLLFWAIFSLFWGLDPRLGLYRIAIVVAGIISALYLAKQFSKIPYERLPIVLLLGIVASITGLWIGLEFTAEIRDITGVDYERYDYNRMAVGLSLLVWPLIFCATLKRTYFLISLLLGVALIWSVFSSESETAKLSLTVGLFTAVFVFVLPKLRIAIAVAMSGAVMLMPILTPPLEMIIRHLPQSFAQASHATHRFQIWKGASDLAMENWLFGWGMKSDRALGASGAMGKFTQSAGFSETIVAPHNLALELWINIGLVGVIPVAILIVLIANRTTQSKLQTIICFGLLVTTFVCVMSGVGATGLQGWFIFGLAINVATLMALVSRSRLT